MQDPNKRGYGIVYREGGVTLCPGCGRNHWHIGRVSAECGFCQTALPLESAAAGGGTIVQGKRRG